MTLLGALVDDGASEGAGRPRGALEEEVSAELVLLDMLTTAMSILKMVNRKIERRRKAREVEKDARRSAI